VSKSDQRFPQKGRIRQHWFQPFTKKMKLVEDFIFVNHEMHPSSPIIVVNEAHKVTCPS
jgi:hypothetical protein